MKRSNDFLQKSNVSSGMIETLKQAMTRTTIIKKAQGPAARTEESLSHQLNKVRALDRQEAKAGDAS